MQAVGDAVVLFTGMPLACLLIIDGMRLGQAGEIAAGLAIAALLGLPSILLAARRHLHPQ
jgi:hypothetical protein